MKIFRNKSSKNPHLVVLLAQRNPDAALVDLLAGQPQVEVIEAFSSRGALQALPGANLVILGELLAIESFNLEILQGALDRSQIPVVSPQEFTRQPEEWLARARLVNPKQVQFLPPRQVILTNWAGGVGKTTLALALCKRFCQATGLPAALLELSLGGSALHARISPDLPGFYNIATEQDKPGRWEGVDLYPMDGRGLQVLLEEEPERVCQALADIRQTHTLVVVDAFPGHPLWSEVGQDSPQALTFVVASPREEAVLQAQALKTELKGRTLLVLNMTRSLADRAESGMQVFLPYREAWADSLDRRLADPLLALVYHGWRAK